MIGTLLIRVDSNPEIASGHLMRCLSIAEEAKSRDMNVVFFMSDDRNREFVEERGYFYYNLNTDWRSLDSEVPKFISLIDSFFNPIMLIDTYSVTSSYISALQSFLPVIYLGSKLNDIGHPEAIINYSSKIDYDFYERNHRDSEWLLGVKFAPLRKEFYKNINSNTSILTDILLTTGGTDNSGFTESFIRNNLEMLDAYNLNCHIVVGSMFQNVSKLEKNINGLSNIILHRNVKDMAALMRRCQLAVSANGTTVYELAACGIPTISFALVKEQEISGQSLGEMGVVDYCGLYPDNETECLQRILNKIEYYKIHSESRIRLGQRASMMIDGKGCEYIVDSIVKIRSKWL